MRCCCCAASPIPPQTRHDRARLIVRHELTVLVGPWAVMALERAGTVAAGGHSATALAALVVDAASSSASSSRSRACCKHFPAGRMARRARADAHWPTLTGRRALATRCGWCCNCRRCSAYLAWRAAAAHAQCASAGCAGARKRFAGKVTEKVEPLPTVLVMCNAAPWRCSTCLTIASPSPVPPVSRERLRSTR